MALISLEANHSGGKSSFLYSAPMPLVAFAFDAGARGTLFGERWEFWKDCDIELVSWPPPPLDDAQVKKFWGRNPRAITVYLLPKPEQNGIRLSGMALLWTTFTRLCNLALGSKEVATVGVDTATLARRDAADAHLEGLQQSNPTRSSLLEVEWGRPGDMIRAIYTQAQQASETFANGTQFFGGESVPQKHFIATHHLRNKYRRYVDKEGKQQSIAMEDSRGNSIEELEGLSSTYKFFDIAMRMESKVIPHPMLPGQKMGVVESTFEKCRFDLSLKGATRINLTWDTLFKELNQKMHPSAHVQLRDP